jgi:lipopolysaccharide cholinephosphotransferase
MARVKRKQTKRRTVKSKAQKKTTSKKTKSRKDCDISKFIVLKRSDVKLLYKITQKTIDILNENNIEYWAEGGTLIGASRTDKNNPIGGFISWDDDVDISIDKKDKTRLMKLRPIIKENGLMLKSVGRYVKVLKPGNDRVWIDIFYLNINKQSKDFDAEYPQKQYYKYNYKKGELFPLKEVPFGSKEIQMKVANKANKYLNRCYPNWDKVAHLYNHHTKGKKKISFKDCPELKKPILAN